MKKMIAFIGLGNMGLPMAENLVRAGNEVVGFDVTPEALERAEAQGVKATSALEEAVGGAEVVVTAVGDHDEPAGGVGSPDGLTEGEGGAGRDDPHHGRRPGADAPVGPVARLHECAGSDRALRARRVRPGLMPQQRCGLVESSPRGKCLPAQGRSGCSNQKKTRTCRPSGLCV